VTAGPRQQAIRFGADAIRRAPAQDATAPTDDPEVAEARLRGLSVCEMMAPIQPRKAIVYVVL